MLWSENGMFELEILHVEWLFIPHFTCEMIYLSLDLGHAHSGGRLQRIKVGQLEMKKPRNVSTVNSLGSPLRKILLSWIYRWGKWSLETMLNGMLPFNMLPEKNQYLNPSLSDSRAIF